MGLYETNNAKLFKSYIEQNLKRHETIPSLSKKHFFVILLAILF